MLVCDFQTKQISYEPGPVVLVICAVWPLHRKGQRSQGFLPCQQSDRLFHWDSGVGNWGRTARARAIEALSALQDSKLRLHAVKLNMYLPVGRPCMVQRYKG